jgi:hypothetical protein
LLTPLIANHGDDVIFKIFGTTQAGRRFVAAAFNPAFRPPEYDQAEFPRVHPASGVVKNLLK